MGEFVRGIHVRVVIDTNKGTTVVDRDVENLDDAHGVIEQAADEAGL